MAKRIFTTSLNYLATAHNVAATQFMEIKGGGASQVIDLLEFMVSGRDTSSVIGGFMLAYASTGETSGTAMASPGSDGPMMVNATALASPVVVFFAATTGPTPSNSVTLPKLNLTLNTFGGIIRWNAAPTQQWTQVGSATNAGISVLWNSSTHGGGNANANTHIIYEPY